MVAQCPAQPPYPPFKRMPTLTIGVPYSLGSLSPWLRWNWWYPLPHAALNLLGEPGKSLRTSLYVDMSVPSIKVPKPLRKRMTCHY